MKDNIIATLLIPLIKFLVPSMGSTVKYSSSLINSELPSSDIILMKPIFLKYSINSFSIITS